jgi:hypothetical protein
MQLNKQTAKSVALDDGTDHENRRGRSSDSFDPLISHSK